MNTNQNSFFSQPFYTYALLALSTTLSACGGGGNDVEPNPEPIISSRDIDIKANVTYGTHPLQQVQFLPPYDLNTPPKGVIIWIHGGGWDHGDRQSQVPLFEAPRKAGYAIVNMSYRLGIDGMAPRSIQDTQKVITNIAQGYCSDCSHSSHWLWTHQIAKKHGLQVAGGSSGGHLAVMGMGTLSPQLHQRFASIPNWCAHSIVGPSDFSNMQAYLPWVQELVYRYAHGSSTMPDRSALDAISPTVALEHQQWLPSAVRWSLYHTNQDELVPLSTTQAFPNLLKAQGASIAYRTVDGQGDHGHFITQTELSNALVLGAKDCFVL